MATCDLSGGKVLGCRDNIGGISEVYIGTWNGDSLTYVYGTDNIIGTFSGATVSFYTFEQEIETGSYQEAGNFSTENGTAFYEQTLTITLYKMDAALRNQIMILGQGKWRVIIRDQRGNYWLMGSQNPVRVSASTPGFGKAYGDLNGAIITFTGKEPLSAYQVSTSAALSVIA